MTDDTGRDLGNATLDDAAIIEAMTRVSGDVRRALDYWKNIEEAGIRLEPAPPSIDEIQKPLQDLLTRHPIFGRTEQRWFGPKQLHVHPWQAARHLLVIADKRGPIEALAWLHKVYGTTQADIRFVAEIIGLELDGPYTLSNGVRIAPLAELPPSPMNNAMMSRYSIRPGHVTSHIGHPPVVAIHELKGQPASTTYDGPHRSPEIERAVRAHAVANPAAAPIVGVSWYDVADSDLEAFHVGRMWMNTFFDGPSEFTSSFKIDAAGIDRVEALLNLRPDARKVCDLAAERLIFARRRRSPANKAIEGAICLEALLLSERSPGEIVYRLGFRAALLLGKSREEKRRLRKAVRAFYSLRSSAVHGSASESSPADDAVAREGLSVCKQALDEIISLGTMPDWTEWELAGGRPT